VKHAKAAGHSEAWIAKNVKSDASEASEEEQPEDEADADADADADAEGDDASEESD
jgi:hypothetical protein